MSMTTLIAGGDSYIYGFELADCDLDKNIHSKNTFTALLSKRFNLDYECVAVPGYSNSAISRSVINQCLKTEDCAVVVSWTYVDRFEFSTDTPSQEWCNISPSQVERYRNTKPEFAKMIDQFLKWSGLSEYQQYYTSLKEIVYLQNFLKVKDIPFMFTSADASISVQNIEHILKYDDNDGTLKNLLKEIDWSHWDLFPNSNGFCNWSREKKFKFGPHYHPLEEAHVSAFYILKDKFNEMVVQSIDKT